MDGGETIDTDLLLFMKRETTIEDIKAAGWYGNGSFSGRWWWRNKETSKRFLPVWVEELIDDAYRRGGNEVRQEIAAALKVVKPPKKQKDN